MLRLRSESLTLATEASGSVPSIPSTADEAGLPDEVITRCVAPFLSVFDVLSAAEIVCHRWKIAFGDDEGVWAGYFSRWHEELPSCMAWSSSGSLAVVQPRGPPCGPSAWRSSLRAGVSGDGLAVRYATWARALHDAWDPWRIASATMRIWIPRDGSMTSDYGTGRLQFVAVANTSQASAVMLTFGDPQVWRLADLLADHQDVDVQFCFEMERRPRHANEHVDGDGEREGERDDRSNSNPVRVSVRLPLDVSKRYWLQGELAAHPCWLVWLHKVDILQPLHAAGGLMMARSSGGALGRGAMASRAVASGGCGGPALRRERDLAAGVAGGPGARSGTGGLALGAPSADPVADRPFADRALGRVTLSTCPEESDSSAESSGSESEWASATSLLRQPPLWLLREHERRMCWHQSRDHHHHHHHHHQEAVQGAGGSEEGEEGGAAELWLEPERGSPSLMPSMPSAMPPLTPLHRLAIVLDGFSDDARSSHTLAVTFDTASDVRLTGRAPTGTTADHPHARPPAWVRPSEPCVRWRFQSCSRHGSRARARRSGSRAGSGLREEALREEEAEAALSVSGDLADVHSIQFVLLWAGIWPIVAACATPALDDGEVKAFVPFDDVMDDDCLHSSLELRAYRYSAAPAPRALSRTHTTAESTEAEDGRTTPPPTATVPESGGGGDLQSDLQGLMQGRGRGGEAGEGGGASADRDGQGIDITLTLTVAQLSRLLSGCFSPLPSH